MASESLLPYNKSSPMPKIYVNTKFQKCIIFIICQVILAVKEKEREGEKERDIERESKRKREKREKES
jgi:hypothetical protein